MKQMWSSSWSSYSISPSNSQSASLIKTIMPGRLSLQVSLCPISSTLLTHMLPSGSISMLCLSVISFWRTICTKSRIFAGCSFVDFAASEFIGAGATIALLSSAFSAVPSALLSSWSAMNLGTCNWCFFVFFVAVRNSVPPLFSHRGKSAYFAVPLLKRRRRTQIRWWFWALWQKWTPLLVLEREQHHFPLAEEESGSDYVTHLALSFTDKCRIINRE